MVKKTAIVTVIAAVVTVAVAVLVLQKILSKKTGSKFIAEAKGRK